MYAEEGDGAIHIETDKKSGARTLVTIVDISTLYKEKRAKSVSLAKTFSTLTHENLVAVYKLYISKKMLYFEMEAPENIGNWKSFCKRKFSTVDILTIFRQICEALEHLHKNGIIHRDVHPTRIHFVNGAAKFNHIGMPYNYKKLLKKENFSGHINYSAPELILEDINFDEKVDVWSLGCCIYYFYTKNDPFEGKTPATIKRNILNESIMKGKSGIDPIIRDLLDSCLVVSPEERPNASKLLRIMDDLEYDYYGEIVSKDISSATQDKNCKHSSLGSPQATYKSYTNNYLPPASAKIKKNNDTLQGKDSQSSPTQSESKKTEENTKSESNVCEKIGDKITNVSNPKELIGTAEPTDGTTGSTSASRIQKELTNLSKDLKLRENYNIFNENAPTDNSWFDKKYLIEETGELPENIYEKNQILKRSAKVQAILEEKVHDFSDMHKPLESPKHTESEVVAAFGEETGKIPKIDDLRTLDQYHYVESNGAMFMGEAIKHGVGILFDTDVETMQTLTYKGEFKYDKRDGLGHQSYKDGSNYNGNWHQDKPHGSGTLTLSDGSTYQCEFKNGICELGKISVKAEGSNLTVLNQGVTSGNSAYLQNSNNNHQVPDISSPQNVHSWDNNSMKKGNNCSDE